MIRAQAVLAMVLLLASGCKDSSGPPAAPKLEVLTASPSAPANTQITNLQFRVTGEGGVPTANATVSFTILAGGGSLAATSASTDANGVVTAPAWRMGKSRVTQTIRATAGTLVLDVNAAVAGNYNIDVRFFNAGSMTQLQRDAFTAAARRIEGIITGDLPPVQFTNDDVSSPPPNGCGATGVANLNESVDDIIIYASVSPIDGSGNSSGNILAQAFPCFVRDDGDNTLEANELLTIVGVMQFDEADIGNLTGQGSLQEVITHEMFHVLGIGSLWGAFPNGFGLLLGGGGPDPRYTGAQGISGCKTMGGTTTCATNVPVEGNTGCTPSPGCSSSGTRDSHWREQTFGSEMMTGFINAGSPISSLTIGALADMGYTVNHADDDGFLMLFLRQPSLLGFSSPRPRWERVSHPVFGIDHNGRRTRRLSEAQ